MTILEFAERICKLTNSSSSIVRMPLRRTIPSTQAGHSKARRVLDWSRGFPSKKGSDGRDYFQEMSSSGNTNTVA